MRKFFAWLKWVTRFNRKSKDMTDIEVTPDPTVDRAGVPAPTPDMIDKNEGWYRLSNDYAANLRSEAVTVSEKRGNLNWQGLARHFNAANPAPDDAPDVFVAMRWDDETTEQIEGPVRIDLDAPDAGFLRTVLSDEGLRDAFLQWLEIRKP